MANTRRTKERSSTEDIEPRDSGETIVDTPEVVDALEVPAQQPETREYVTVTPNEHPVFGSMFLGSRWLLVPEDEHTLGALRAGLIEEVARGQGEADQDRA